MSATQRSNGLSQASARGRVREDVRRLILCGELRPGTRLTQQALAKRFGVAQSVVRESLVELQASGLVRLVDNLGVFVSNLDVNTLIHAYHIREVVEGLAARLSCERASRADIRELHEIADKIHAKALAGRLDERGVLDHQFHHRTILIAANPLLQCQTGCYQMLNIVVQAFASHERILEQHHGIAEAIEKGNGDEAERRARAHVVVSRDAIAQAIAERGQGKDPSWTAQWGDFGFSTNEVVKA
jgi:DNA-binding GntR family transcriptional regulator